MRIKEILKEKGMTLQELADKMDVSRQALSRQVGGKLLVEKAEEIACMLDVPMWQLFASPAEVAGDRDFLAIIKYKGELKEVTSVGELEKIVSELKKGAK